MPLVGIDEPGRPATDGAWGAAGAKGVPARIGAPGAAGARGADLPGANGAGGIPGRPGAAGADGEENEMHAPGGEGRPGTGGPGADGGLPGMGAPGAGAGGQGICGAPGTCGRKVGGAGAAGLKGELECLALMGKFLVWSKLVVAVLGAGQAAKVGAHQELQEGVVWVHSEDHEPKVALQVLWVLLANQADLANQEQPVAQGMALPADRQFLQVVEEGWELETPVLQAAMARQAS